MGTLQNWFDVEIMEKISDRDRLFEKFKMPCLHVDKDNYKEVRNEVQKLICTKKKTYFETFDLLPTETDYILKILRNIETSKAAGIDSVPGRFLNDGANILAKLITGICNLSMSLNKLPSAFKLAEVKSIFKKGWKMNVLSY